MKSKTFLAVIGWIYQFNLKDTVGRISLSASDNRPVPGVGPFYLITKKYSCQQIK